MKIQGTSKLMKNKKSQGGGGAGTGTGTPKKKEREGPRKALSAYNLFFQAERVVLLDSLPVRPQGKPRRSHGKLPFTEMARIIGARWKAITAERRAYFDDLAVKDKERYAKELEEYKAKKEQGKSQKKMEMKQQQQQQEQQQMNAFPPLPQVYYSSNPSSFYSNGMILQDDNNYTGLLMEPQQPFSRMESAFAAQDVQEAPVQAFEDGVGIAPAPSANNYNVNYYQATSYNNNGVSDDLMPIDYRYDGKNNCPPSISELAKKFSQDELNCVVGAFL